MTTDYQPVDEQPKKVNKCLLAIILVLILALGVVLIYGITRPAKCDTAPSVAPEYHGPKATSSANLLKAQNLRKQMTHEEKINITQGWGWESWNVNEGDYIGNTWANKRLNIPSLKMQDAGNGFRTLDSRTIGQVTSWPSALALTSNWDRDVVLSYGVALGKEFTAKGANVVLSPGVNVARVALCGRNLEYLSGEDPYLGAELVRPWIEGVQSQGVMTVTKHFVGNNQENNRNGVDAQIDERTLFEVYYPPYAAAVEAGTTAFMCSYNIVNGSHACNNKVLLTRDLKGRMGFEGLVMSDWWAVHDYGYEMAGMDLEMPGTPAGSSKAYLSFSGLKEGEMGAEEEARLNDMVDRILKPMYDLDLFSTNVCSPPDCSDYIYKAKATSDEHVALARATGAKGAILLKNEGDVLPLKPGSTVAIVGSACDADDTLNNENSQWFSGNYYVIGGSGRVLALPKDIYSIKDGLAERNELKLQLSLTDNVTEALDAMEGADVVITCGGAVTQESFDRSTLALDQDDFIMEIVSNKTAPVVVLAMAPGAITANWADDADAAALMFLGGQESGHAWADVLMGDVNFQGKLPVTIPMSDDDTVKPCEGEDTGAPCPYTEKLNVGWKGMAPEGVRYPFGYGLSYTTFGYKWMVEPTSYGCDAAALVCMTVLVSNNGIVPGRDVAQLYVTFPEELGEPAKVLKGFQKTPTIEVGGSALVTFQLLPRDLSWFDVAKGDWSLATGDVKFIVGPSSADERLTGSVTMV